MIAREHDFLLKPEERGPIELLHGEFNTLHNTDIELAFQRILQTFKPKHNKAIFSLCTSTRPYIQSIKWATFNRNFGGDCDLIVCSNGGIIPMEYMCCYPFLEYDAHREPKYDELYNERFEYRLETFLEKFGANYKVKVFSFLPSSRNRVVLEKLGYANIVPTDTTYQKIKNSDEKGINLLRYPQCSIHSLREMSEILGVPLKNQPKSIRLF